MLRCAAYSGATGVELYDPAPAGATVPPGGQVKSSAIDHFHEKLFKLEGMMKVRSFALVSPASLLLLG